MTIYKVSKFHIVENTYFEEFYTNKENAEKVVNTIKEDWKERKGYYSMAILEEIETKD